MYKVTQMFKLKEEVYRKQSEKLLELLGGIKWTYLRITYNL